MDKTTAFLFAILAAIADLVAVFTWLKLEPSHIFEKAWWTNRPVSITRAKAFFIALLSVLSLGLSSYGYYGSYASKIPVPRTLAWGVQSKQCFVVEDTSAIVEFAKDYFIVLACGVVDPTVDVLNDKRIILSNPFNIYGTNQQISAASTPEFDKFLEALPGGPDIPRSFWQKVFLLPKDREVSEIHQLSDVPKVKGKLF